MIPLFLIFILISQIFVSNIVAESYPTSSVEKYELDPALKEFSFDIGYGTEYFTAYIRPDIQSFTRGEHKVAKKPNMNGHAVKFINMSPDSLRLYWYVHIIVFIIKLPALVSTIVK